ncbi:hypothetical protein [Streptomyces sp. NPDC005423]|uniref:hypothetical protein n=1 Tax=Streptomyces sp. NPDC005423 TaxID=3155343 RepID=UPI0033B41F14
MRALLAVLDEAVAAQEPADAAVASCGEPGPVSGQAARDCGDASSAFLHLRARLWEVALTDADLVHTRAYAGRLLDYDQWMVHQSVNLAFTVHPDVRTEVARLQLKGLGRPADDLRRLRDTPPTAPVSALGCLPAPPPAAARPSNSATATRTATAGRGC